MRYPNMKVLTRLLAAGEPFAVTGTPAELQYLLGVLPPALTFLDYPGDGNPVKLTYYPTDAAHA